MDSVQNRKSTTVVSSSSTNKICSKSLQETNQTGIITDTTCIQLNYADIFLVIEFNVIWSFRLNGTFSCIQKTRCRVVKVGFCSRYFISGEFCRIIRSQFSLLHTCIFPCPSDTNFIIFSSADAKSNRIAQYIVVLR